PYTTLFRSPVRGTLHERTQPPSGGVGVHRRGRTWGTAFGRRPELGARPRGGGRSRCGTTNAFATGADPGRGGCGTAPEDPGGAGRRHVHSHALIRAHPAPPLSVRAGSGSCC